MTLARTVDVVPSLLSADFSRLAAELRRVQDGGAEWVTVDAMDGHFVPNLSFGPDLVRAVKRLSPLRVDAHLMVTNPEAAAPWFVKAGADRVIFHLEACPEPEPLLRALRGQGVEAGVAVKPGTPVDGLLPLLAQSDLALVMTVEPGFGGAAFLSAMLPKISALRRALDAGALPCRLQADGGINLETVEAAASAGADVLVAGHGVFGNPDPAAAIRTLRAKAQAAYSGRAG
ncbi:MAG: ribulose-phosphate 3-epimerase [Elusimicrobia bacterium]|nr:ribulose-phosphate 3-epimerase [Elusimicrobiota bacterium]